MAIKARKLKKSEIPERTKLYEVRESCDITVEEKQSDGSLDQVILEYRVKENSIGYFAKEYRPETVPKDGAKVIDITAVMLSHADKWVKWYLYDIKDTLAGEGTVVKLYNQWSFGLRYLQQDILNDISEYSNLPNLGVITRFYDEERMKRLRNKYKSYCDEIEQNSERMPLSLRKNRTNIAKYRAIYKAAQAILDRTFRTENETNTYRIQIEQMIREKDQIYKMRFPV